MTEPMTEIPPTEAAPTSPHLAEPDHLLAFDEYLERARRPASAPIHWEWTTLSARLNGHVHGERGTFALVSGACGPSEIAPGVSAALQVVGETPTRPHTHAFWHIYVVQSGAGTARLGTEEEAGPRRIASGDILFVPPWCPHAFAADTGTALRLLALQNLPQMAQLGTLMRRDGANAPEIVYADGPRPL